jgi:ComF family protein
MCNSCVENGLEPANPSFKTTCNDIILPEHITFQDALYHFDKGGGLQKIMHALKYNGDKEIGHRLGEEIGRRLLKSPLISNSDLASALIVPVPLHEKKERKRGFNQAREIAKGVSEITLAKMISPLGCKRLIFTQTQTGFTRQERKENMKGVFEAERDEVLNTYCIIIDDVFTTGATTFELIQTLIDSGADKAGIITIAQA